MLAAAMAAALLALLVANDAAAAKIYKCEDAKKKVTISDRPCNENAPQAAGSDKAADADKKDGKAPAPKADEKKDGKKG
jgi:hypothetical protein